MQFNVWTDADNTFSPLQLLEVPFNLRVILSDYFFSYQQLTNITCSRLFAYIIIWTRVSLFWPWPIEHQKRETWNYNRRKNHPFGNCKFWKEAFRNVKSSIFNSASALIALVHSFCPTIPFCFFSFLPFTFYSANNNNNYCN